MKKLDIIHLNGKSYAVDNQYLIGGKFLGISERETQIGDIKSFEDNHVNGNKTGWNANWYYPEAPMGVFHIVAATDKSLNLPLLPAVEEDMENLAREDFKLAKTIFASEALEELAIKDWVRGYKAASKKKYSEEDMEAAVAFGITLERLKADPHKLSDTEEFKGFIQSLNPLPIAIEVEMEDWRGDGEDPDIGNSAKHLVWPKVDKTNTIIGRYIYE